MPLYSYKCLSSGFIFDRFAPMADSAKPQDCACGAMADRVITATRISVDYAGYNCPVTGKWISGRRQHEENLKRTDSRLLEPGETEAAHKYREKLEADFDRQIETTVEKQYEALPSDKKEKLANELLSGLDVSVERR
jgi:putative FmdB family regulatory protein